MKINEKSFVHYVWKLNNKKKKCCKIRQKLVINIIKAICYKNPFLNFISEINYVSIFNELITCFNRITHYFAIKYSLCIPLC